jgi:hypothetical protein
MWIIHDNTGNIVSNGRLTEQQAAIGLQEKEVADVSIGDCVWDSSILDYVPINRYVDIAPIEFLQLFTIEERAAIRTAAKTDIIIEDFLAALQVVNTVNLGYSLTVQGLQYFESLGLITSERLQQIRGL